MLAARLLRVERETILPTQLEGQARRLLSLGASEAREGGWIANADGSQVRLRNRTDQRCPKRLSVILVSKVVSTVVYMGVRFPMLKVLNST